MQYPFHGCGGHMPLGTQHPTPPTRHHLENSVGQNSSWFIAVVNLSWWAYVTYPCMRRHCLLSVRHPETGDCQGVYGSANVFVP